MHIYYQILFLYNMMLLNYQYKFYYKKMNQYIIYYNINYQIVSLYNIDLLKYQYRFYYKINYLFLFVNMFHFSNNNYLKL